jgi:hypothetical protein
MLGGEGAERICQVASFFVEWVAKGGEVCLGCGLGVFLEPSRANFP